MNIQIEFKLSQFPWKVFKVRSHVFQTLIGYNLKGFCQQFQNFANSIKRLIAFRRTTSSALIVSLIYFSDNFQTI